MARSVWLSSVLLVLAVSDAALGAQLTLTWVGSADASLYAIERQEFAGPFFEIARTAAGVVSYIDSMVTDGTMYCYRVRAANAAGFSDYSNLACGTPDIEPSNGFADNFDRPDSDVLGNGWTKIAGVLMIRAGQVQNAPVRTMHSAVQEGLTSAGQTVSARFASSDNTRFPHFGVILRYQDTKNYYACERRARSSLLRIVKVVGGSERVLRSVSVRNPVLNAFFTLGCQAEGQVLTLFLDGVAKVKVTDSTFASGSVGLMMGYVSGKGAASSHLADDFSATLH